VPCGLALAPVLPGLTDSPAALEEVVRAAAEHAAQWLWSGTLHLEPAVRDWFLASLARHFPQAVPGYSRVFGAAGGPARARYAPKRYAERVTRQVDEVKARYGLAEGRRPAPRVSPSAAGANLPDYPLPEARRRQLALPL
jgi:DNA repair photolyase